MRIRIELFFDLETQSSGLGESGQYSVGPVQIGDCKFELSVAARTDKELEAILRPAQTSFDEEWYKTAQELFPEWQSDKEAFDLALSLVQHLMEGIAISAMTHPRSEHHKKLHQYLEDKLRELAPKEIR